MSYIIRERLEETTDRSTGKIQLIANIVADDAASLPANTADLEFVLGSEALCVDSGLKYRIDSNGNWIQQPGSAWTDVYSKSEVDALLAALPILSRGDLYRGYQITANTDIDTLTDYGTYYCDSGTTAATLINCPITATGFIMINYSNGNRVRIFYAVSANYPRMLIQARTGGVWRTIREFITKDEADTLYAWLPATLSGTSSITFDSDGTPLTAWSISGNMVQTGTPTPSVPIQPTECGDLVTTGEHAGQYAIPITLTGQTQTVYLSEPLRKIGDYADTVEHDGTVTRKIGKAEMTGTETWYSAGSGTALRFYTRIQDTVASSPVVCTHFTDSDGTTANTCDINSSRNFVCNNSSLASTVDDWKSYVSQQYQNGTPVTVWHVLATPTTETVTVPTLTPTKGSNTMSVGTTLQPSEVSITGGIR